MAGISVTQMTLLFANWRNAINTGPASRLKIAAVTEWLDVSF
jgi:hypothetical protein